jgi:hypothetical protein
MSDVLTLIGRILIATLFLAGAAQKTSNPAAVEALLAAHNWPLWLIWPAGVFNLGLLRGNKPLSLYPRRWLADVDLCEELGDCRRLPCAGSPWGRALCPAPQNLTPETQKGRAPRRGPLCNSAQITAAL